MEIIDGAVHVQGAQNDNGGTVVDGATGAAEAKDVANVAAEGGTGQIHLHISKAARRGGFRAGPGR